VGHLGCFHSLAIVNNAAIMYCYIVRTFVYTTIYPYLALQKKEKRKKLTAKRKTNKQTNARRMKTPKLTFEAK
jgi:hypothetical protein